MLKRDLLKALINDSVLLSMLATEIGEAALHEPSDDEGGRSYFTIGVDAVNEMLSWPLDDERA